MADPPSHGETRIKARLRSLLNFTDPPGIIVPANVDEESDSDEDEDEDDEAYIEPPPNPRTPRTIATKPTHKEPLPRQTSQPATKSTNYELVKSKPRGGHPLHGLPDLLTKFIALPVGGYASLCSYLTNTPGIWKEEAYFKRLQEVAVDCFASGRVELGERVVERAHLLNLYTSIRNSRDEKVAQGWLVSLNQPGKRRSEFEQQYKKALEERKSTALKRSRESTSAEKLSSTRNAPKLQAPPAGNEASSGSTRKSAPPPGPTPPNQKGVAIRHPLTASNKSKNVPTEFIIDESADRLGPLSPPRPRRPTVGTVSEVSDLSSNPRGPSYAGPKTDILRQWPQDVQDPLADYQIFKIKDQLTKVFAEGSLFAIFWHENHGQRLPDRRKKLPTKPTATGGFATEVANGEWVYSHIRRFVVATHRHGHCIAVPINSYGNRGLSQRAPPNGSMSDADVQAHAIIHAQGNDPQYIRGEPIFTKEPICVEITAPGETLSAASRLFYAKPQSIEYNIKVKHLGYVIPEHIARFMLAFQREITTSDV